MFLFNTSYNILNPQFLTIQEQDPTKSIAEIINTSPGAFISITDSFINLFLAMVVAILLKKVYDKYESVSQNNLSLSSNFLKLTLITTFIISVVKSSLALSLGLVGALSIVRFRTAIKEPTELIYLFFCIAIGLGFGANLPLYTLMVSLIILFIIVLRKTFSRNKKNKATNMFAEIKLRDDITSINELIKELQIYSDNVSLIRHDYSKEENIVSLKLKFEDINSIDNFKASNWFKSNIISFSFFEDKGIF